MRDGNGAVPSLTLFYSLEIVVKIIVFVLSLLALSSVYSVDANAADYKEYDYNGTMVLLEKKSEGTYWYVSDITPATSKPVEVEEVVEGEVILPVQLPTEMIPVEVVAPYYFGVSNTADVVSEEYKEESSLWLVLLIMYIIHYAVLVSAILLLLLLALLLLCKKFKKERDVGLEKEWEYIPATTANKDNEDNNNKGVVIDGVVEEEHICLPYIPHTQTVLFWKQMYDEMVEHDKGGPPPVISHLAKDDTNPHSRVWGCVNGNGYW